MAEDREISRELWEGRVPVSFALVSEDVEVGEQPDPMYLMVPRQSYFPLTMDKVYKHFSKCVSQDKVDEMWLEYDGQALKWHYPIGVLFDLYAGDDILPWNISVHFQNFPEEELLTWPNKDAVEAIFMSMIKEADALKHRSQVINSMQKKDHRHLWTGLQHDKFDQFWSVNRKLMETTEEMFKYIPYRLYQTEGPYQQHLFRPITEEGHTQTLHHLLQAVAPEFWPENGELTKKVLIQGIEPRLDTSIHWLSEHFSHPDNFLHICVLNADKTDS